MSNGGKWKKYSATRDARSDGRGGGVIKQRHIKKKLSNQQCVQLCQFDIQLVNAQCSDLSVLCESVRAFSRSCMMIPLIPPLTAGWLLSLLSHRAHMASSLLI